MYKPVESKRYRTRFSMLTLLLVTTIVAMGLGLYTQYRRIQGLNQMVSDAGYLQVNNKNEYHAIYVPKYEELTYRWRVWLPQGRKYRVGIQCNRISSEDLSGNFDTEVTFVGEDAGDQFGMGISGGEVVMTYAVRKDKADDGWRVVAQLDNLTLGSKSTTSRKLDKNGGKWPDGSIGMSSTYGLQRGVFRGALGSPFVLFRKRTSSTSISSNGPPADGLLIWIEELPLENSKGN